MTEGDITAILACPETSYSGLLNFKDTKGADIDAMLFIKLRAMILDEKAALYFWNLNSTIINDLFSIISGDIYIVLSGIPFVLAALIKLKKKFLLFLLASVIAVSVSDILCYRVLKPSIKRLRPVYELSLTKEEIPDSTKAYSMPSNHASNIFAFFMIYLLLVKRYSVFFLLNAIIIALSRVIIVKHFLTDVIAGIVLGSFIGLGTAFFISSISSRIKGERE